MLKKVLLLMLTVVVGGPLAHAQNFRGLPVITNIDDLRDKSGGIRYLDVYQGVLPSVEGAGYYEVLQRVDSAGLDWRLRRYSLPANGLVLEQFFTGALPQQMLEGPSREWYPNGQLREELQYHKNLVAGTLRTYYPGGQPRRVQVLGKVRTAICYDSAGNQLSKCPPYHTFATLGGKDTYSGKFLKLVQQQYQQFLPVGYRVPKGEVVEYAFRIDPTGRVQEPRIVSPATAAPEVQAAIIQAIKLLPIFGPATYEGQATDDVLHGFVQVK